MALESFVTESEFIVGDVWERFGNGNLSILGDGAHEMGHVRILIQADWG